MPSPVTVLIDAHNVIHQEPTLRALMRDPEIARRELERRLEGRGDCILFYDGGPGGVPDSRIRAGIRVEYAGSEEADELIVRWLRAHPGRRHAVVSDDRALRARCRALGARTLAARGFLARVGGGAHLPAKPEAPDSSELAHWLRVFGGDR